jgi:3-oxoacyl-[acyl-carrier-protein] synthase II
LNAKENRVTTRIVITGLGAITPIGNDVESFWTHLTAGVSGAGPLTAFDAADFPVRVACEVKGFDPTRFMSRKVARHTARVSQFAVAAARQALSDAGMTVDSHNAERVGVMLNTGGGGIGDVETETRTLIQRGPRRVSSFFVPRVMPNAAACLVSLQVGARGPVLASALACASGSHALLEAFHYLRRGEAEVMIAGGSESLMQPVILAGLAQMGALSRRNGDPAAASRPFDAERDGFVPAEGAAVMILETEDHARRRAAPIYAEVLGGRLTADAHHITAPDPDGNGAARAMRGALESAGLSAADVEVVFAHGTSTRLNDAMETRAIRGVFGAHADRLAVPATKSMLGHALGAAGAMSVLAAALSLRHSLVPPTINYTTPDPACDLDYVPHAARRMDVRVAMVNAFGFGGQNVALLLGRYAGEGSSADA